MLLFIELVFLLDLVVQCFGQFCNFHLVCPAERIDTHTLLGHETCVQLKFVFVNTVYLTG